MRKTSHKFWNWITPKTHSEPKPKVPSNLRFNIIKVAVIKKKSREEY